MAIRLTSSGLEGMTHTLSENYEGTPRPSAPSVGAIVCASSRGDTYLPSSGSYIYFYTVYNGGRAGTGTSSLVSSSYIAIRTA